MSVICFVLRKNPKRLLNLYHLCSSFGKVINGKFSIKSRERMKFRAISSHSNNVFLLTISFIVAEIKRVKMAAQHHTFYVVKSVLHTM